MLFGIRFLISPLRFDVPMFNICINILYWCFSFWLTSVCLIGSSFIHLIRTDSNAFFLIAELCVCTTAFLSVHLLFICSSRLLPCPGYCKQFCDEHWGICVSFNSGFLGVYAQQWIAVPYMQDNKRDTDVKNRLLDSVGEGEGGMIWENSTETCILSYVK